MTGGGPGLFSSWKLTSQPSVQQTHIVFLFLLLPDQIMIQAPEAVSIAHHINQRSNDVGKHPDKGE
ncbi:MAG: hypothetical protein WC905_04265 [Patescibacteria group bacterium]